MNLFYIFGGAAVAILAGYWLIERQESKAYKAGRDAGYTEGFQDGRIEADGWWFNAESNVDRERVRLALDRAERAAGQKSEDRWP